MNRFVGVDLGIRTRHRAVVLDGSETHGKPFSVEVSRAGFDQLLHRATEGADGPAKFVLEPTGLAWVPVAAYVSAAGHAVYLVPPQKASRLRKFLDADTKSDSVDAEAIGRVPQLDPKRVTLLRLPTTEQMALRRLVKRHERLMQQAGDQKRRIHALMIMANPPLMEALGEAAFGAGARAFLRKYADPEKVIKLGLQRLRKFWDQASRGTAQSQLVERVFEACRTTAELYGDLRRTGRLPFDFAEIQHELTDELDWMEHAEQAAERLESRIAEMYDRSDPEHTLEQLAGFGPVIAPAVDALVGDIGRFRNGRRFVSYCGICPRKKQSGTRDQAMPITKAGQRLLKKYLYLAADVARHYDPDFAAYYARRYAQGDHHNRILLALARKMALRVYALLTRREQARQVGPGGSASEPVRYQLRNPDGSGAIDKKQARALIAEKYTREVANPERHKREQRRRGTTGTTGPAKVKRPSKDATNGKPAPPSQPQIPRREIQGNLLVRRGSRKNNWDSIGEILARMIVETSQNKL